MRLRSHFAPAATATAYVASSGKAPSFMFNAAATALVVTPTQGLIAPTVAKNGVALGSLGNPLDDRLSLGGALRHCLPESASTRQTR